MFDKQKAEHVARKIQKHVGNELETQVVQQNGEWIVKVIVSSDKFSLDFKGVKIEFERKYNEHS